jgi:hypothetical protein
LRIIFFSNKFNNDTVYDQSKSNFKNRSNVYSVKRCFWDANGRTCEEKGKKSWIIMKKKKNEKIIPFYLITYVNK